MRPKKRILLVNADDGELGVMRFTLETNGFLVRGVSDAAAVPAAILSFGPDLLIVSPAPPLGASLRLRHAAMLAQVRQQSPWLRVLVVAPELEREDLAELNLLPPQDQALTRGQCGSVMLLEFAKTMCAHKRGPRKGVLLKPPASELLTTPVVKIVNGEEVRIAPLCSMGCEMLGKPQAREKALEA